MGWYEKQKRDLPFRKNPSVYRVWVSEVMLQQTRVAAMLPLYEEFIKKFPNIETLAKADVEEVLAKWKGLGYYSRAKNLWKGAQYVLQNFNGIVPKDLDEVLKIPGVGEYTSRAILSIGYHLPFAVVDGNVIRVLSRIYQYPKNVADPKNKKELQELADLFFNRKFPSEHNQAMMELGATVCTTDPKCLLCPISQFCQSYQIGNPKQFPIVLKEKKKTLLNIQFLGIAQNGKFLLVKDPSRRFFKTIYSLPYIINSEYENSTLDEKLSSLFSFEKLGTSFSHTITHHKIQIHFAFAKSSHKSLSEVLKNADVKWVEWEDLEEEFTSSIAKKIRKNIPNFKV